MVQPIESRFLVKIYHVEGDFFVYVASEILSHPQKLGACGFGRDKTVLVCIEKIISAKEMHDVGGQDLFEYKARNDALRDGTIVFREIPSPILGHRGHDTRSEEVGHSAVLVGTLEYECQRFTDEKAKGFQKHRGNSIGSGCALGRQVRQVMENDLLRE